MKEGIEEVEGLKEIQFPDIPVNPLMKNEQFEGAKTLLENLFRGATYFAIENLFIDVYSKETKKNCAVIQFTNDKVDIADKDYVSGSKKTLELYDSGYEKFAEEFIRQYKKKYMKNIKLIKAYKTGDSSEVLP